MRRDARHASAGLETPIASRAPGSRPIPNCRGRRGRHHPRRHVPHLHRRQLLPRLLRQLLPRPPTPPPPASSGPDAAINNAGMAATARSLATLVMMISPSSLNPRPRPGDATHPDHVPSLRSKSGAPNDVPRKKKGGAPLAKSRLPRVFGIQPWSKEKMLDGGSGLSATSARQRQIPRDIIGRWFIVTAVTSVVILIRLTGLRAVTPANSVPTSVLHALTVFHPDPTSDLARADPHARRG